MIKVILTISKINYDEFLDRVLEMAKQHPEQLGGMKLPPFSGKMLRMVPQNKKNEMLAQAVNGSKDRILPQAEMMMSRFIGPVRLKDMEITCEKRGPVAVTVMIEIAEYDRYHLIDHILPMYYSEQSAPLMLGDDYAGSTELSVVQSYMKQQDFKTCQFLIARSMSVNRERIMQMLERGASANGMELRMDNIRLMVK